MLGREKPQGGYKKARVPGNSGQQTPMEPGPPSFTTSRHSSWLAFGWGHGPAAAGQAGTQVLEEVQRSFQAPSFGSGTNPWEFSGVITWSVA